MDISYHRNIDLSLIILFLAFFRIVKGEKKVCNDISMSNSMENSFREGGIVYTDAIVIPGKTERKEKRWQGNIYIWLKTENRVGPFQMIIRPYFSFLTHESRVLAYKRRGV